MKNLTAKHKKVEYCNKNKLLPSVERLILFVGVNTKSLKLMFSFSHPHFSHLLNQKVLINSKLLLSYFTNS